MKKILLVNPDTSILLACRRGLEWQHFEVEFCTNLYDALIKVTQEHPDLMLFTGGDQMIVAALKAASPQTIFLV